MSQFQGGLPRIGRRISRRSRRLPELGGNNVQPNAPGIQPQPAASAGAQQAEQLARSLGLAGQAAQAIGQAARRETRENQQQINEISKRLKGQARLDAIAELPKIKQRIAEGELTVPEGQKVDEFAKQLVEQETDGAPEPYAERFRDIAVPELANAFVQKNQEVKKQAREEDLQLLQESIQGADNTEQIRETLQEARRDYPDLSESQLLDKLVVPKLRTAASTGDQEGFETAVNALDGRFPGTVKQLRGDLQANIQREQANEQAQEFNSAENIVAQGLNQDSPNHDHLLQRIDEMDLQPSNAQKLRDRIESDRRQSIDQKRTRLTQRVIANVQSGRWEPERARQIAREGANIFAQNPDNPSGLTPNQVQQIQNVADQTEQVDRRQQQITRMVRETGSNAPGPDRSGNQSPQSPRAVLNSGEDDEFEAALIDQGILTGEISGPGDATVTGFQDPTMAATQFSRFATIPNDAKDLMARGFNISQDEKLTEQSVESFVALWNINRPLAERFKKSLSDRGRLRAEFALNEMMRNSPARMNQNGEVSDEWLQRRQDVAQAAANLEPPAGRTETVNQFWSEFTGESNPLPETKRAALMNELSERMRKSLQETWGILDENVDVSELQGSTAAELSQFVEDARVLFSSPQVTPPKDKTINEAAVDRGMQRFLAEFSPKAWGEEVTFDRAPYPFTQWMRDQAMQDIKDNFGDQFSEDELRNNFTISYDDDQMLEGLAGAWVLHKRGAPFERLEDDEGNVWAFRPSDPSSGDEITDQDIQSMVQQGRRQRNVMQQERNVMQQAIGELDQSKQNELRDQLIGIVRRKQRNNNLDDNAARVTIGNIRQGVEQGRTVETLIDMIPPAGPTGEWFGEAEREEFTNVAVRTLEGASN